MMKRTRMMSALWFFIGAFAMGQVASDAMVGAEDEENVPTAEPITIQPVATAVKSSSGTTSLHQPWFWYMKQGREDFSKEKK